MNLLSCHIENFGRIHDLDYVFEKGLNRILEDNGWGKSTFADFILAMFYGFDGDQKKSIAENRRKRYAPWQQGAFGGTLTFESGGKRYRIERSFGYKNGREDELRLYNADTNLPVSDCPAVPGETFFGINRESFARTVYVAQQDCSTEATADIHAKIGRLTGETSDISEYEIVQKRLKEKADKLTPARKTGELNRLNRRLQEIDARLLGKAAREAEQKNAEQKIRELHTQITEKEKQQNILQDRMAEAGARKDIESEYRQFTFLRKQEREAYLRLEAARSVFPGEIPDQQLLAEELEAAGEWKQKCGEQELFRFTEDEKAEYRRLQAAFEDGVPTAEKIEEVRERIRRLQNRKEQMQNRQLSEEEREKWEGLHEAFAKHLPDDSEMEELIRMWEERNAKKAEVRADKNSARMLRSVLEGEHAEAGYSGGKRYPDAAEQGGRPSFSKDGFREPKRSGRSRREEAAQKAAALARRLLAVLVLLFTLAAAAALGLIREKPVPAWILAGVGFLLALFLWISGRTPLREREVFEEETDDGYDPETEEEYRRLRLRIRGQEERVAEINHRISDFLAVYDVEVSEADVAECLWQMRSEAREYRRLQKRYQEYERSSGTAEIREEEKQIRSFLQWFYPDADAGTDPDALIRQLFYDTGRYRALLEKLRRFERLSAEVQEIQQEILRFFNCLEIEPDEEYTVLLQRMRDCRQRIEICTAEYNRAAAEKTEVERKLLEKGIRPELLTGSVRFANADPISYSEQREEEKTEADKSAADFVSAMDDRSEEKPEKDMQSKAAMEETESEETEKAGIEEDAVSVKELAAEVKRGEAELKELRELLHAARRNLDARNEEVRVMEEAENEKAALLEEKAVLEHRYEVITKTGAYLRKAKEQFASRYMDPIQNGFEKYYRMIDPSGTMQYVIDADWNISFREAGGAREVEYLSAGLQDLVGLCRRMAMIEAMYEKEKPFLLLDDPFVNLDEKKLERAMRFVQEIAKEYQVILFSCHSSRL
ncbi:MAG: AAA family ATPase [Eubacteriales bacterium]|nr:AAA family ATPase [Eubacteriales bacterium]